MGKIKKGKNGSLKRSFLLMTLLPIFVLGVVISLFSYNRFRKAIYCEVENELKNTAYIINNTYERMYPGDYSVITKDNLTTLLKGDAFLIESLDFLENIKEDTQTEISIFYGDVRYVTTLTDSEGNSLLGTSASYIIKERVMDQDKEVFFDSVTVDDAEYAAYYMPVHNADGITAGMLAVLRQSRKIDSLVRASVMPIIVIVVAGMIAAALFTTLYSQSIIRAFGRIRRFLISVERGELRRELDGGIVSRNDELGEMGRAAVNMQKSIRQLIEKDMLTDLYNRRYATMRLVSVIADAEAAGTGYAVSIGDIDYFKCFNDTYGHDMGDKVLIAVSSVLKNYMSGKGFASRWGGEEFLLVFEDKYAPKAEDCLNELLQSIRSIELKYEDKEPVRVSMSFGVAIKSRTRRQDYLPAMTGDGRALAGNGQNNTKADAVSADDVLKRADELLYHAKSLGKNQVVSGII